MEKATFRQRHPLFSKPVIGLILAYAVPLLLTNLIMMPYSIVEEIFSIKNSTVSNIIMSAAALITLVIHKRWFREEFSGCFYRDGLNDRKVNLTIFITFVLVVAVSVVPGCIKYGVAIPSLEMTTAALAAGVAEETIFRAFPVSVLMRGKKSRKLIVLTLIITSLIFGLSHASNLLRGAAVQGTIVQIVSASVSGLLLCAIYIRTGSIIPGMLFHAVYDYACFMQGNMTTGIVGELSAGDIAFECVSMVIEIAAVITLLRGHTDEIINRWNEIWKMSENSSTDTYTEKLADDSEGSIN